MLFAASIEADEISVTNEVLPGIFIHSETQTNPPERFWVANVDLKNPKLKLRVSRGGADPDGNGKWQTTLMEPTKIADREKFDLVINGDFFIAKGVNDGEGTNSMFRAKQWAMTEGPAMTDGVTWSVSTNARPCLVIHSNGVVSFETITNPAGDDLQVIAGRPMLVLDGKILPQANPARHPRTVVGLNSTHDRLTILLVDGRKTGIAAGMTYTELAQEMVKLGCTEALNLDGGGSSVLAVRENGKMKILNEPTDGRERAVADVLGISVEK
jgi:exopolysaccharide biosynthesis protein